MPQEYSPSDEERAKLHKLKFRKDDQGLTKEKIGDPVPVQFNPESLSERHQSQISTDTPKGNVQIVGKGNRKLDVTLFFDVTHPKEEREDVREMTKEVRQFVVDRDERDKDESSKKKFIPPGIRFDWGSFQFDGMVNSINESLDFFSPNGTPLRATLSITIHEIEAKPKKQSRNGRNAASTSGPGDPEMRPEGAENTNGTPLQQLAGEKGRQDNWKDIAAQNDIENPRSIYNPGAVDLSVSA